MDDWIEIRMYAIASDVCIYKEQDCLFIYWCISVTFWLDPEFSYGQLFEDTR